MSKDKRFQKESIKQQSKMLGVAVKQYRATIVGLVIAAFALFVGIKAGWFGSNSGSQTNINIHEVIGPVSINLDPQNPPKLPVDYEQIQAKIADSLKNDGFISTDDLLRIGNLASYAADFDRSLSYYRVALDQARRTNDRDLEATASANTGLNYRTLGLLDSALYYVQESVSIYIRLGVLGAAAMQRVNLSMVLLDLGRPQDARDELIIALDKLEADKSEGLAYLAKLNLGLVYYTLGSYDTALKYLRDVEQYARSKSMPLLLAHSLANIGLVHRIRGDLGAAEMYLDSARSYYSKCGDRKGVADEYANLGLVYDAAGDTAKALASYRLALRLHMEVRSESDVALDYGHLAASMLKRGNVDSAAVYYDSVLSISRRTGFRMGEGAGLYGKSDLRKALGDPRGQLAYADSAYRVNSSIQRKINALASLRAMIEALRALEMWDSAAVCYRTVLRLSREQNDLRAAAMTANDLGTVLEWVGLIDSARYYYNYCLTTGTEVGSAAAEASARTNIAKLQARAGFYDSALTNLNAANIQFVRVGDHAGEALTRYNIAVVYGMIGDLENMQLSFRQAVQLCIKHGLDEAYCKDAAKELDRLSRSGESEESNTP